MPKKRKKTKFFVGGIVAILIIGAIGGFLFLQHEKTKITSEVISEKLSFQYQIRQYYYPDRESYGEGVFIDFDGKKYVYDIGEEVFKNLPPIPDDFHRIKYNMMSEGILDLEKLDESYWKQPEFIANTFVDTGLRLYQQPSREYWYPIGIGTYPAIQYIDTFQGAEFDIYTFFYTAWGVQTYQGVSLVTKYPSGTDIFGYDFESAEDARKYITVESISPDVLLLTPSYPLFSEDWIHKVKVKVKVSEETPKGTYLVGIDVSSAPAYLEKRWASEYLELYQPTAQVRVSEPQLRLVIVVG